MLLGGELEKVKPSLCTVFTGEDDGGSREWSAPVPS